MPIKLPGSGLKMAQNIAADLWSQQLMVMPQFLICSMAILRWKIRHMYDKWPLFPSLIFIGLGVRRQFNDIPLSVSGFSFPINEPVQIGNKMRDRISVHLYHHDKSMAPEGAQHSLLCLKQIMSTGKNSGKTKWNMNRKRMKLPVRWSDFSNNVFRYFIAGGNDRCCYTYDFWKVHR